MKSRVNKIILAALLVAQTAHSAYKNADAARQAVFSAHVRAFSVENLLKNGVPQDGPQSWYGALNGQRDFINEVVAKARTIPISQANKDRFARISSLLQDKSDKLINGIKILRGLNSNFDIEVLKKRIAAGDYTEATFNKTKEIQADLARAIPELGKVLQELAPETFDIQDTKDVKKLLHDTVFALMKSYEKEQKDFDNLKAAIRLALDGIRHYSKPAAQ